MITVLIASLFISVLLNIIFAFSLGRHAENSKASTDMIEVYNKLFTNLLSEQKEQPTNKGD